MEIGCVQVYTGDGKGKTTAAMGLAVRASGHGMQVYFGQFMKGQDYGELRSLPRLGTVTLEQYGDPGWCYKGKIREAQRDMARVGLEKGRAALFSRRFEVVILDEINMAVWFELISEEAVLEMIGQRPKGIELVLTGRRASQAIMDSADLVTEMKEIKHYYQQKIPSRKGIEN